jgi:hypothetical protein
MRMLIGAIAALAVVASTGAHAQGVYIAGPAPVYVEPAPYAAAPVVVAPAQPYVAPAPLAAVAPGPLAAYAYAPQPYTGARIVNPVTGRWCRTEPSGYQFCWTP